jgi:hypothetical protein
MTAVQPAASAGARERMPSATGEFHGAMIPGNPYRLADDHAELAVTDDAHRPDISQGQRGVEPKRLRRESDLDLSVRVHLPVLEPEQLHQLVCAFLEAVGHPV